MTRTRTTLGALAALALCACQTVFHGAPHVEDGPTGCRKQCEAWDMDLAGMVKMGQYSDGCICQVRPQRPEPSPASRAPGAQVAPPATAPAPQLSVAAAGAAVAGVWAQMEQQRQQQQYANQPWAHPSSGAGYPAPVGSTGGWGGGGWR